MRPTLASIMLGLYDTKLSPDDESAYQNWVTRQSSIQGRDISGDVEDYDVRGLFRSVSGADLPKGHGTDRFKKPNHPTFSNESVYHSAQNPGGTWTTIKGKPAFIPSEFNLRNMPLDSMREYFKKYEPGVTLVEPKKKAK